MCKLSKNNIKDNAYYQDNVKHLIKYEQYGLKKLHVVYNCIIK